MIGKLLRPEISEIIQERDFTTLRDFLIDWPAADTAELISELPESDRAIVFRVLPKKQAADAFEYLELEDQKDLLKAMAKEQVVGILNEMEPDDRTALLEELPPATVRQLLELLSPEERAISQSLLGYPENSVGRLMTPGYIAVKKDWSVKEVLDYVRQHGQDSETLNVLYVVDDKGQLIDDIRMREVLLSPIDRRVSELMDEHYIALNVTDDQETAAAVFKKYDRFALPVVDSEGSLIGMVTLDDMLDIVDEEATEDIQKFGGVEALEEPYLTIALTRMVKKRASWLILLFLGEMLTATAMGFFEKEIAKAVVLALFVPLIISSGGNSGSQAATLIIRAMALGEVTLADWWRVMRREILSGLMLGCILGSIGFVRIAVWSAFSNLYGPHWPLVAATVAFALVGVVLWGTLAGSMLPFLLRRLGADPATSSAPFVATLVDVTGLLIYFTVAIAFLRGALL
jgi:magnesium transporter